jgi:hypothetical protein
MDGDSKGATIWRHARSARGALADVDEMPESEAAVET